MNGITISEKLLPIIRSAFDNNSKQPELDLEDYEAILDFGKRQSLMPLLWKGLKKLNYPDEQVRQFEKCRLKDMRNAIIREHTYNSICSALNRESIAYIPLKGSVIKDLYPESWMRTSCDIDILV